MRINGLRAFSLVDGPGIRYTIFLQGCPHHCPGCHNEDTWDPESGFEESVDGIYGRFMDIHNTYRIPHSILDGITLSGGEPFLQQDECVKLLKKLPDMNVWIYTGYEYEEIKDTELAKMADYLVVGKFEADKKVESRWFGSSNQRIINAKTGEDETETMRYKV